jgi:D-methionine transport system ATP-binding protein
LESALLSPTSASVPLFQLDQVSLVSQLGNQPLLSGLSFHVNAGERIALLGASGAGKTTLLQILNRLITPTTGRILFQGHDLCKLPVLQLRQQVVLVPQESKLLGMTVQDALAYPLRLRQFSTTAIQERVQNWMERLHIPSDWCERTEAQLSVGQRQWVAIARALVIQPPVLLLDEPTSALDAGRSEQLLTILNEYSQEHSLTLIMVNHQWELAPKVCNRVLYLQQGELKLDQAIATIDWAELQVKLKHAQSKVSQEWE